MHFFIYKKLTKCCLNILFIVSYLVAFSKEVRRIILQKARYRSELSGHSHLPLDASHLDHTRNKTYNEPWRGEALTILEHCAYHVAHIGFAEQIGLSEDYNRWAAITRFHAVKKMYTNRGVVVTDHEIAYTIGRIIHRHFVKRHGYIEDRSVIDVLHVLLSAVQEC